MLGAALVYNAQLGYDGNMAYDRELQEREGRERRMAIFAAWVERGLPELADFDPNLSRTRIEQQLKKASRHIKVRPKHPLWTIAVYVERHGLKEARKMFGR